MKKNSHAKKKLAIQKFQNDEKFECDLLSLIAYAQNKRFIGEAQGERGERFFLSKCVKVVINHWKLSIYFMITQKPTPTQSVSNAAAVFGQMLGFVSFMMREPKGVFYF